jgi:hypothetical protein
MTPKCVFAPAFAFLVAACAGSSPQTDSPFYEMGFADGCASASAEITPVPRNPERDETLYAQDSGYRSGWNSGHTACLRQSRPARL